LGSTTGLLYVREKVDICGGVIHSSDRRRFCCKSIGSCTTKGHKTKLTIDPNSFYIQHTRFGQARYEPSLSEALIPLDVTPSDFLSQEHPLEVWTAYFDALKAGCAAARISSPGSDNDLSTPWEEVPSLDSVRKASVTFQTPKRLRMGSMLSPENVPIITSTRGSPLVDVFPLGPDNFEKTQSVKVKQALRKLFGDWNKIESNFQTVHQEIDSAAKSETKFRNSVSDVISNMQDATREMDIRVQILQASLGGQVDDPEGGPMPIWDPVARLRTLGSCTTGISDGNFHYLDELQKKLPNWGTTLENMATSYIDTIPKINRNLAMMKARLATLESGSSTVRNNPIN
jgi:hypothetical protein